MSQGILAVAPTQWGNLSDIDDIQPINSDDFACLSEIREVLKKHGKRERFGVALLHKHFDMDADEILVEYTNKQDRILTIKPVKRDEAGQMIETIWEIGDDENNQIVLGCRQYCGLDIHGNHNVFHNMT